MPTQIGKLDKQFDETLKGTITVFGIKFKVVAYPRRYEHEADGDYHLWISGEVEEE